MCPFIFCKSNSCVDGAVIDPSPGYSCRYYSMVTWKWWSALWPCIDWHLWSPGALLYRGNYVWNELKLILSVSHLHELQGRENISTLILFLLFSLKKEIYFSIYTYQGSDDVACYSDFCTRWWNWPEDKGHTFCLHGNRCWPIAQNQGKFFCFVLFFCFLVSIVSRIIGLFIS